MKLRNADFEFRILLSHVSTIMIIQFEIRNSQFAILVEERS